MKQLNLFPAETSSGVIKPEEIFKAYFECRRHKRRTVNALRFELNYEPELVRLWQNINSGLYRIDRSIAFVVSEPVKREVFAADFRDRIIHHLVIGKINDLLEQEFIPDSYSCRKGKGTLYGVKRIQKMIEECSTGGKRDCYILKLDIRSFFMSINKRILYRNLYNFIKNKYRQADCNIILRLIYQIIFNHPEDNCIIKGKRQDWNGLPYYKSLFWSNSDCGLPIGNLTSQLFANFYLTGFDKYVIEELGIKYYGRYVDDFVLIHEDKEYLKLVRRKVEKYLWDNLKLKLHPQKVYLQHYSKGVRFIGAFIKRNYIQIGKRTKANLYQKIHHLLPEMAQSREKTLEMLPFFGSSINSYIGFMKHYNTYRLRSHILKLLDSTFLSPVIKNVAEAKKLDIDKDFLPRAQKKRQLRQQRQTRKYQNKIRINQLAERKQNNGNV
ncbi:MAG: RNA-directed DNA polymerase [Alphaproteobacteria bacterium]|nr:RNA-directed DNA polymerase [Alphaproteobacteria bacterium]